MSEYWNLYWDYKYIATVPFCLVIGYLIGRKLEKEACEERMRVERIRLAVTNTKPVYLEDMWGEG